MAYQNVATPRFYVNVLEWLALNGVSYDLGAEANVFHTLPVTPRSISGARHDSAYGGWALPMGVIDFSFDNKGFIAILGHKIKTDYVTLLLGNTSSMTSIVNGFRGDSSLYTIPLAYGGNNVHRGYSISTYNGTPTVFGLGDETSWQDSAYDWYVGSVVIGTYYDMKNAPNLSLTMSREYGGTKEMTSYNGSSFSNTFWTKNPDWYDKGAWELGSGSRELTKSGRRGWQLSFSFMDGSDLFGSNQALESHVWGNQSGNADSGDLSDVNEFNYTLLTDDNFFSQEWHKSAGGTIPMIFQADNTNNSTDQFAIVRIRDKSLKATRVAPNTYDISLTLEEVW